MDVPTHRHAILGTLLRELVLSIGRAGSQLGKLVSQTSPTMQVGLEAGTGVGTLGFSTNVNLLKVNNTMHQQCSKYNFT